MQKNRIKTQRLTLREITEKDADLIVLWRKNPDVYQYFRSPHELTYEEHMNWYKDRYLMDSTQIQFIAEENIGQKSVGVFSVRRCADTNDCVEVSYLLDRDAQGNGYAKEAVLGMIEFAQKEWNAVKAIAEIHVDNQISQKMIQRLGFRLAERNDNFLIYERLLCCT